MASVRRKADPGPPGVVIRDARTDDLAAVVRLDAEATGRRRAAYWKGRLALCAGPKEHRPAQSAGPKEHRPAQRAGPKEHRPAQSAGPKEHRPAQRAGGRRDRFFLVACRGKETVGFIVGDVRAWELGAPPSGWIFAINVKRSARLAGVGSLLFDALCARFRAAGVDIVRTMPSKDAQLILSFFRSQGLMAGPFVLLEKRLDA